MPSSDTHRIVFQPSGQRAEVPHGISILQAGREIGVEIESICSGLETCGKCAVFIEEGFFPKYGLTSSCANVSSMTESEQRYFSRRNIDKNNYRLSCSAKILGDLVITVPEESQAKKQIIRKGATERVIELDPAIRQYYVQVAPASLEDNRGDWQRLKEALVRNHHLEDLQIDPLVLPQLQSVLRAHDWQVTVSVWNDREVVRLQPGYEEGAYGFAVDIGTTTVAAHLCDLRTGKVLTTVSAMNPQVSFGEDIMSRISYAMMFADGLEKMNQAIIRTINDLLLLATKTAGLTIDDVTDLTLVGNTVMHHIVLNIDPTYLGGAPFSLATSEALDLKAREMGIHAHIGAYVHILPCEAGYVGADNVAVMLAESPHEQPDNVLILDIGTNGEIILSHHGHVLSASSPTGPAFEGAEITFGMRAAPGAIEHVQIDRRTLAPRFKIIGQDKWSDELPPETIRAAGICGSGIIDAVAGLFAAGILLKDGRLDKQILSPYLRFNGTMGEYVLASKEQTASGNEIIINQKDIRAIQLAKGALYAGARLLMDRRGIEKLDRVILAGAFGSYIDKTSAMIIGLFPDCDLKNVYAVGNAAGDGARIALLSRKKRQEAAYQARKVEYVNTATLPQFQEQFIASLALPHSSDAFPHLDGLIPEPGLQNKEP